MKAVKSIVGAPFKAVLKGIKKTYKAITKSTFGKALLIGATIYLGGAALGYWNSPFQSINGALVSGATPPLETATSVTEAGGSLASVPSATVPDAAAVETLGGSAAITPASEVAKEMAASSITAGGGAPAATGVYSAAADTAGKGIINSMMSNPLAQYGLIQAGAGALQGAFSPNAIDVADRQAELARENEKWRQDFLQPNFSVDSLNLGMSPSGQPLRDAQGNLLYPTQPAIPQPRPVVPTGIINNAMRR